MHRLIVVDFCQWLDIDLKLWCTEKLNELMRYGMTATQPTLEQMINNPDLVISLATQLKSEREEKQRLALEVQKKEQREADYHRGSKASRSIHGMCNKLVYQYSHRRSCETYHPKRI